MNDYNKYFQKQKQKMSSIYDVSKPYQYRISQTEDKRNIIELIHNGKVVLRGEYELAGVYTTITSIWYWAYNIQMLDRKLGSSSKKVKKFSKTLKENRKKYKPLELEQLHYISSNGNFYASGNTMLECVKLMMYLTKGLWYIPICYGKTTSVCPTFDNSKGDFKRVEYLIIKKIL